MHGDCPSTPSLSVSLWCQNRFYNRLKERERRREKGLVNVCDLWLRPVRVCVCGCAHACLFKHVRLHMHTCMRMCVRM